MAGNVRPLDGARPEVGSSVARAQPAAVPILASDPAVGDLPTGENGDPVPIIYVSDGSAGVTGDSGDLILAAPNGSGGVDAAVAADISASITLGEDATGLF